MLSSSVPHHAVRTLFRVLVMGLLLTAWVGLPRAGYSAPAAINWYVATIGNDANTCLTALKPCEHIQTAIDKAASGDTINIAAGTYNEILEINDKDLTLTGQGAATTIINGQQQDTVLNISANPGLS